jgi:hypothetical protein
MLCVVFLPQNDTLKQYRQASSTRSVSRIAIPDIQVNPLPFSE